eukprot:COSAG01_NODE_11370_length_1950_cov_6.703944_2_plen_342_part_00
MMMMCGRRRAWAAGRRRHRRARGPAVSAQMRGQQYEQVPTTLLEKQPEEQEQQGRAVDGELERVRAEIAAAKAGVAALPARHRHHHHHEQQQQQAVLTMLSAHDDSDGGVQSRTPTGDSQKQSWLTSAEQELAGMSAEAALLIDRGDEAAAAAARSPRGITRKQQRPPLPRSALLRSSELHCGGPVAGVHLAQQTAVAEPGASAVAEAALSDEQLEENLNANSGIHELTGLYWTVQGNTKPRLTLLSRVAGGVAAVYVLVCGLLALTFAAGWEPSVFALLFLPESLMCWSIFHRIVQVTHPVTGKLVQLCRWNTLSSREFANVTRWKRIFFFWLSFGYWVP